VNINCMHGSEVDCGMFVYPCFYPAIVERLMREVVWCHMIWKIISFILIFKIVCAIGWTLSTSSYGWVGAW
jgi:hypothetical protein